MIAFSTKAAGPSLRNVSKADPISKPKARFCPTLRSLLISGETGYVLARCKLETQTASVRLGRKFSNLIDLCEILCSDGKENIPSEAAIFPLRDGKSDSCHSRRSPLRTCSREMASCSRHSQRPRPIAWQVE